MFILLLLIITHSVYFHLNLDDKKCYIEEAFEHSVISVQYKFLNPLDFGSNPPKCTLSFSTRNKHGHTNLVYTSQMNTVKNTDKKMHDRRSVRDYHYDSDDEYDYLYDKNFNEDENADIATGAAAHLTKEDSIYLICLHCANGDPNGHSRWGNVGNAVPLKWSLLIDKLGDNDFFEHVPGARHLEEVEGDAEKVFRRVDLLLAEGANQKRSEYRFRNESEKLNGTVQFIHIVELVVILIVGVYQVVSLKKFFHNEI